MDRVVNKTKRTLILSGGCIVFATFLWSTDLFFRYDLLKVIDPISLVFLEHLIILIALCPMFLPCLIPLFKLNRRYIFAIMFVGAGGSAVGTVAFSYAFAQLNPVVPIVLQKLQPFVAIVGAELILREKHPRYFYFFALIAIVGAVLLSEPYLVSFVSCVQDMPACLHPAFSSSVDPYPSSGLFAGLAVGSAFVAVFCWGLSTVFGRMVSSKVSPRDLTFLRIFFGFLTLFLWVLWIGADTQLYTFLENAVNHPVLGLKLTYMALIIGLLSLLFYYHGLKHVPAKLATLLELFYPVFSLGLAYVFLNQTLNWIQIIGMALVVIASTVCTVRGFK